MGEIDIDLTGLEGKWTRQSLDYPPCAACGLRIGEDRPEAGGWPESPLRLFRGEGDAVEELDLHWKCAEKRMRRDRPDRN